VRRWITYAATKSADEIQCAMAIACRVASAVETCSR